MNKIALIAVRLKSSRLSKKALLTLAKNSACELSLLEVQLQRLKQSTVLDKIVVCTSTHPQDNDILPVCEKLGVPVFKVVNLTSCLVSYRQLSNIRAICL